MRTYASKNPGQFNRKAFQYLSDKEFNNKRPKV